MGLPTTQGALVADVTTDGPAAKAGLDEWRSDHWPLTASRSADRRALPRIVADTPIGKTVNIDVLRKGKKQTMRITVAEAGRRQHAGQAGQEAPPPPPKNQSKLSQLGLSLGVLDGGARAKFKIGGDVQGVVVSIVDPGQPGRRKEPPARRRDRGSAEPGGEDARRCIQGRSMPTSKPARRSS